VGDPDSGIADLGLEGQKGNPSVAMLKAILSGLSCEFSGPDTVIMHINMMGKQDTITNHYEVIYYDDVSITIKNTDGTKKDLISTIYFTDANYIKIVEGENEDKTTYLKRPGAEKTAASQVPEETAAAVHIEEQAVVTEPEEPAAPRIMVILPEQIDAEWFWYYYTDVSQHIVQAAVEKKLIRAGFDVIDLMTLDMFHGQGDLNRLWDRDYSVEQARTAGADYLILGRATATQMSHDVAYGVNVFRSSAEITARLVRIADGRILAVEDASATAGGQAQRTAGRDALKDAAKKIARRLVNAVEQALATE
jgi:hypothetical protein